MGSWVQQCLKKVPLSSPSIFLCHIVTPTEVHACLLSHSVMSDSFETPMDCSPPGSSVHGISQARMLEWVACPPPRDLPNPVIEPTAPAARALAGEFFTTVPPAKPNPH